MSAATHAIVMPGVQPAVFARPVKRDRPESNGCAYRAVHGISSSRHRDANRMTSESYRRRHASQGRRSGTSDHRSGIVQQCGRAGTPSAGGRSRCRNRCTKRNWMRTETCTRRRAHRHPGRHEPTASSATFAQTPQRGRGIVASSSWPALRIGVYVTVRITPERVISLSGAQGEDARGTTSTPHLSDSDKEP